MPHINVGILSIGTHLPTRIRLNSEWPASFLERFGDRKKSDITTAQLPASASLALSLRAKYEADPFRGSIQRRVLEPSLEPSDMEVAAARQALDRANVHPDEIDLVIVSTSVPDLLGSGNASVVHHKLGLKPATMVLNLDNVCNSVVPGLVQAAGAIKLGHVRKALLVQSAAFSRIVDYNEPGSVNFGDAASAMVVGPVAPERGILGWSSFNDGSFHRAVCMSPAGGGTWFDAHGRLVPASLDLESAKRMIGLFGSWAQTSIDATLADAGIERSQVGFFACHQPTVWFKDICANAAGITEIPSPAIFPMVGGVGPSNLPIAIDVGVHDRSIVDDTVLILYAMGSGAHWASMALRWGS